MSAAPPSKTSVRLLKPARSAGILPRWFSKSAPVIWMVLPGTAVKVLLRPKLSRSEKVMSAPAPVMFNAPVPLLREISRTGTVYAAMLRKPDRDYQMDRAVFETLLMRSGPARLVAEIEDPIWFRVYCLKPSAR